jgi:WD40 repeat protein
VSALAVSDASGIVAIGRSDGTVEMRAIDSAATLPSFPTQADEVTGLAFTGGGQFLLIAGRDGTTSLWDLNSEANEKLLDLPTRKAVSWMTATDDLVVFTLERGHSGIRRWDLPVLNNELQRNGIGFDSQ